MSSLSAAALGSATPSHSASTSLGASSQTIPTSEGSLSLPDVLASQAALEAEASEAIPFSFTTCTYSLASIEDRQPLYSCLSCRPSPGTRLAVCAGCSIACHGDCELVELFSRRDFVCDCGTTRVGNGKGKARCTLSLREGEPPDAGNRYDRNFDGIFCVCGVRYDPDKEEDEMIQCIMCEDWLHLAKCLSTGDSPTPAAKAEPPDAALSLVKAEQDPQAGSTPNAEAYDDDADRSMLSPDSFDYLVCEACVLSSRGQDTIARYAGSYDFALLYRDGQLKDVVEDMARADSVASIEEHPRRLPGSSVPKAEGREEPNTRKRSRSRSPQMPFVAGQASSEDAGHFPLSKKAKSENIESGIGLSPYDQAVTCTAPPRNNPLMSRIGRELDPPRKDVYLLDGWRERLCRCADCLHLYTGMPYLLNEESVYEPPTDPDSSKSLYELGETALCAMPREQAIQGAEAYMGMRDRLRVYLEPFAREGKVVSKEDVERFFEEQREKDARGVQ